MAEPHPPTSTTLLSGCHGRTYVVVLSLVAALGGLLFGYDTAVISGAVGFLKVHFELGPKLEGWAVASALVGCVLGASLAGTFSDRFGRKRALLTAALLFTVSAVGSAIPRNLTEFAIARMLGGVGVGMAAMLSPLYIAEIAPAAIRGRLVSVNQLAIVFGMLVVYFVNTRIAHQGDEAWNVDVGWRWMFASETLPAALFFVLLWFVPESPRWLAKQGACAAALSVLTRIHGDHRAQRELDDITDAIAHEQGSVASLLAPGLRRALIIGVGLAVLQQVTGINVVLYYAPEIFKNAGLESRKAIDHTVIVGLTNLVFTLVAIAIVDRVGRKPLLMVASAGMGASLILLGGAFVGERSEGPWVLLFVLLYVASFAVAMGPVVWVVISEIFPTRIRGRAMSVATVCLWIACFMVSQWFPLMLDRLRGHAFFVYAAMCVVALLFVWRQVPETRGRSLEQIEQAWTSGSRAGGSS